MNLRQYPPPKPFLSILHLGLISIPGFPSTIRLRVFLTTSNRISVEFVGAGRHLQPV